MIDIKSIIKSPYENIKTSINKDIYRCIIKCTYREALEYFKIDIECQVENDKYCYGSVEMSVNTRQFVENGTIIFEYLEVASRISNRGVGTFIMNAVIEIAKDFKKYYNRESKIVEIRGWLSNVDYQNGNWNNSLPFYQKVAKINNVEIIFRGRESEREYVTWQEFIECEAGKDGDVIFRIVN